MFNNITKKQKELLKLPEDTCNYHLSQIVLNPPFQVNDLVPVRLDIENDGVRY